MELANTALPWTFVHFPTLELRELVNCMAQKTHFDSPSGLAKMPRALVLHAPT
jgi:hypothetical protein